MPVQYRVDRIEIRSFRGLETLDVSFQPGTPTYLVGANNSGKSTVLNAIACAFRQGAFLKSDTSEFDFFRKKSAPPEDEFTSTVFFAAEDPQTLPAVQGVSSPLPVHGIRSRGRLDADGHTDLSTYLVDANGKAITFSQRLPIKNAELKKAYKDHDGVGFQPRSARPQDIQGDLPEVWHLRPDNIYPSLYTWKSGPLMRLAKLLGEQFFKQEWTFKFRATESKMPQRMILAHEFFRAAVAEFPFWKDVLKPKFDKALSDYLGRDAGVALKPSVQRIEEWLTQQLAISFAADAGGAITPLESMGDGWQSMVRLAALDVLRQMPDQTRERIVLLYEEPEAFLHPHLRRKLREVLADLAAGGWTVVCTTHAPEFISFVRDQQIVRLSRSGDTVSSGRWLTSGAPTEVKLQEKLDEHGNHEMLFANAVVLCEGKDDEHALRAYLQKANVDIDGKSVSVLGVSSVNNLQAYAELANTLGIRWCAVLDEDKAPGQPQNPKTAKVQASLEALRKPSDRVSQWKQNLEACMNAPGGTKALPSWQEQQFGKLTAERIAIDCPEYSRVGEEVKSWLNDDTPSS